MKKHKILLTIFILFVAVNVYSALPIASFYLKKGPKEPVVSNKDAIKPLASKERPYFSFIVISDTGSGIFFNEAATLKVISSINREDRFNKVPIDFVINVGDVTYRGKEAHYKNYMKIKSMIKFPVIDSVGNHDDDCDNGKRGIALFRKYCGREEFSFVDRNSYFIVLDNKGGDFTEAQFKWFENELNKGKNYAHTFVFLHKPPFNPVQKSWYRIETNPWSHRFLKLCERYRVDKVFSGHESAVKSARFGSVEYIVTGGGGTPMMQPSSEGGILNYIIVKVNNDYTDFEVRRVYPPAWEFFTFYMWRDLLYFLRNLMN